MTMKKKILNQVRSNFLKFFPFLASTFTNRAVLISLGIIVGGGLGWSVAGIIQLALLHFLGPATLGYTSLPILIFIMAIIGGIVSFFISHFIAADNFFKPKLEPIKENIEPVVEPVATLASAPVAIVPLVVAPTAEKKYKFPHVIPDGTNWENITMIFLDEENVSITVGRWKAVKQSYLDFGMIDGRGNDPKPSEQWAFLRVIALLNGEISFRDKQARWSLKKQKHLLSKKLKEYFDIAGGPFFPYHQFKMYKIRMTIGVDDAMAEEIRIREGENPVAQFVKPEDEIYKDKMPGNLSDEEEDGALMEGMLDEEELKGAGFHIESR